MLSEQTIRFQWATRDEDAAELAIRVAGAIQWLRALPALAGEWTCAKGRPLPGARPEIAACSTPAALEEAITDGAQRPSAGGPVVCYELEVFRGTFRKHLAKLRVMVGFKGAPEGTYPNHAVLTLRTRLSGDELRQAFVGLAGALRPAHGFVSVRDLPSPDRPPVAGWLTFLDPSFGDLPPLPPAAVVFPLATLGVMIQAFSEPLDPSRDDHRRALRELKAALMAASTA